jgi:DNA-binding NtrC family response regulator
MRLLIVGSLQGHIADAGQIALQRGAKVGHTDTVETALAELRAGKGADLIMVDVEHDVAEMIRALEAERIFIPVVACGIGNDSRAAVNAIKAGAKEYVPLPPDAEMIAAILAAVAEETTSFVTRDPSMADVLRLAERVAPADASILITGESGTGKEVMARHIHGKSKRADKPFISVNCAAIPENLLESELFGHEKGAFTGAVARRIGKFEEANGGTLLLDEISELDPRLQAKLLRAIQEKEIERVGGNKPVKVDIRLISTTNRDMDEAVRNGDFREDLYFRLNVVNVDLPPLRDRPRDIDLLTDHFLKKYAEANGVPTPTISHEAMDALRAHTWPGNVRELENAIHRAVLLAADGVVRPDSVQVKTPHPAPAARHPATSGDRPAAAEGDATADAASGDRDDPAADSGGTDGDSGNDAEVAHLVGRTVADVERDLILNTLEHCLGNRTHAANILGISIRTLRNKLKAYSQEGVRIPAGNDGGQTSEYQRA